MQCQQTAALDLRQGQGFSREYWSNLTNLSTISVLEVEIWRYRGGETVPLNKEFLHHALKFFMDPHAHVHRSPRAWPNECRHNSVIRFQGLRCQGPTNCGKCMYVIKLS
ncbi:uncharacterized protein EDB91DRAFT_1171602, partial [Suillus paluster]|uniref:uncharacterized protein n=1 Tax=Suillus paluster TaxID=48578 RepID=UPI001B87C935